MQGVRHGYPLSPAVANRLSRRRGLTPASALFLNGEPGYSFENWDMSTMFQNRDGSSPVVGSGQPVGVQLDKSRGLALGADLQANKGMAGAALGTPGTYPTNWGGVSPSNGINREVVAINADSIDVRFTGTAAATGGFIVASQFALPFACLPMQAYRAAFVAPEVRAGVLPGTVRYQTLWFLAGAFVSARDVTDLTYVFVLPLSGVDTFRNQLSVNVTIGQVVDVTLRIRPPAFVRQILGNHRIALSDAARGTYGTDGIKRWLAYNGTSTYATPVITPGTDKVQVFAGIRKLSDTFSGMVAEFSPASTVNNGSFALFAPQGPTTPGYMFRSRGTLVADAGVVTGFAAPISNVLTGIGDIGGDVSILRANGVQIASAVGDQGTGNYLPYQAYHGARAGSSVFLNGHEFYSGARFGPTLPAATIAAMEAYVSELTL